jgi:predicted transcriptional regulator
MPSHPPLHELETKIMAEVWSQKEATVRSVTDALADDSDGPPRSYTTILTVMRRLDSKGFLDRRREGKKDIYRPAIPREEYMQSRSEVEVDALVEAYGDLALTEFARRFSQLEPSHRRALQRRARQ